MILIKNYRLLVFAILLTGLFPLHALAQFEIHPRISLGEEYNDNLFLDETDEEDDWVTTVEPGININYYSRSINLNLDYSLQYIRYAENSDENIDDFEDMQRADIKALFFDGRPFTLTITELIARETLDEREDSFEGNEVQNRSTVYRTSLAPSYRLQLAKSFSVVFDYVYDRVDFTEDAGNDIQEHIGRVTFLKELSNRTEVFLRYAYTDHKSEDELAETVDEEDFDRQDYTAGVTHQFGPRLSGSLEGGYSEIEYDDGSDANNPFWLLELKYRLFEALSLEAMYEENFRNSATEGLTEYQAGEFSIIYAKDELTANAGVFWEESDFVRTSRNDQVSGVRLGCSVPLTKVFTANFDAQYEEAEYQEAGLEDEEVDRITLGTSLGFEYRRVLASLGYRYRKNDSNLNFEDYTNNIYSLRVSMRF